MMRIDKVALRAEANCIDVAKYIGINVVNRGANSFILCPGHEKRLGKPDMTIGNCAIYPDGYVCFACGADTKHDVFEMVMEHTGCTFTEALETVADIYGGANLYKTSNTESEKLPLTAEDLKLIGLRASGRMFSPVNGSYQHFEPEEGTFIEKTNSEYLVATAPSSYSLLNLKRDNEKAFNYLIASKAKEAGIKYTKALRDFGDRKSPRASVVFDLFNEDGGVDDSVFFGIQNALKKKIWRCKEIYDAFNKKSNT